jgi:glycine/D-amino acid oxidase-like deaminating enzyme
MSTWTSRKQAGSAELLRPIGWMRLFGNETKLDEVRKEAEAAHRDYGVGYRMLDGQELAAAEPHLLVQRAGALHWTDPYSVSDPHALTLSYAHLFEAKGGRMAIGDAATLQRAGEGWRVQTADGPVEAAQAVIALGAAAGELTRRFGYAPPFLRQARLPLPLRPARQRRAEPPRDRRGKRLLPGAHARRHPPDHGRRIRPPRRAGDTHPA